MSDNLIISCLSSFCSENSCCENTFAAVLHLKELDSIQRCTVLETICNLLEDARYTTKIAEHFRPILLILLTSVIPIYDQNIHSLDKLKLNHRRNCFILGKLITSYPDVLGFALHYFEKFPAPFSSLEENGIVEINEVNEPMFNDTITDCDIVSSSYNILKAKPHHFKRKWNWSEFYKFLIHSDNKVKWMAWNCIAIVLDMSESLRLKCVTSLIDSAVIDEFTMNLDKENANFYSENILSEEASKEIDLLLEKIPSVISVSGVLLPILNNKIEKLKCSLVTVPSMKENLRSLALAVATGKCVCVQGTVGCGKTSIIEYMAKVTGRSQSDFIRVQLGDQIDSKVMLGNYRCTEIPGEFIWLPGILTKAVTEGKWLLLEDIDSATMDVSSTLSNLLETGTLSVPGHRDLIQVNSGFQLFVTQRLFSTSAGLRKPVSNASNMLSRHWTCVNMEPLLRDELITIVETLFPKLRTVASKMVDVFLIFQSSEESDQELINISSRSRRLTSTRDLMKWCSRADVYYKYPTSEEEKQNLFEDAIDVFCCSASDEARRQSSVIAIGLKLGINKVNAENIFQTYKPSITCEKDFIVGRAKLPCKTVSYASVDKRSVTFSFTRPSACLLERIACCVAQKEPVLLVGETGTGKTSSIQYLAKSTGNTLIVINMNQLSESADLLGGYKPVDIKFLIRPIREEFELLFRSFFAVEPNKKYLEAITLCYKQEKWDSLLKSMTVSARSAIKRLKGSFKAVKWENLLLKLEKLSSQVKSNMALGFAFVEGSLVKAIQKGYWVLLDEINLANAETLEYLSGLLEGSSGSLSLLERGDEDLIERHPDFTLFACMNPATDVGKKELPIGFRNRFTEFFVDELTSKIDLQILVDSYLKQMNLQCKHETIVNFYISLRKEAHLILFDGTMNKPHYSLRTLCRALSITAANPCEYELRSLYEAFCLSFLTQLDHKSYPIVENLIRKSMLEEKAAKRILSTPISRPKSDLEFINFEGYWITKGTEVPKTPENYILTTSVRRNLKDIARAVSIGKMPILLQGDTSVGKTSLITYLSKASGHVCVRINNHEHTDLQEYVGSYVADETGKLVFREGILVEAMRKGYWIILDELNLAPSDVLEALNRVLDDNRELFISETQQVVKAHNEFMLFATQNPPGLYGGRKVLSRAFRNRFVEFHFDEIPPIELQEIMQKRCSMPESYCKQIINVMKDLQIRRKTTAAFAGKKGFITLRDLFRWGERFRLAPDVKGLYDWSQHLADEGYLVLASKVRLPEEEAEIRQVIKKHLKRDVIPQDLFTLTTTTSSVTKHILEEILREDISEFKHIVWTYHLRRMAVLLKKSSQFREPVLLVGETGCGKTTNCQLVAAIQKQQLHVVNCHMHTESSDFLGNLRPVRSQSSEENQKLFEWVDGPLIHAMRNGDLFLADEISLADDSVLERLNSLLEPERTLVLAEKGIDLTNPDKTGSIIVAKENFLFVGTMNPGGDYGKKELSPALRNRFTEIWCDPCTERDDLKIIIEHNLWEDVGKGNISECILNFLDWMKKGDVMKSFIVSTRDLLSWVDFINVSRKDGLLSVVDAVLQGACLTYIDGLGSNTNIGNGKQLELFKDKALAFLEQQLGISPSGEKLTTVADLKVTNDYFGIEPFFIEKGHDFSTNVERFTFLSSTTKLNTLKLLRAMQIKKPILLEGSPGVGKTSLVSAVARASGHSLFRINLSDQTDVCDLFGTDLPVEGGKGGEFSWRDGPFLRALRAGHWILLDELNLASQAVLESLNACFDHRGELFIPELGKTFNVTSGTKFFACQNPMKQGGARRGLPKSFLNRFTQVFVSTLTDEDLKFICYSQFPELSEELVRRMVDFNTRISSEAGILWGLSGSPWEMNLRDVIRWCEATISSAKSQCSERDLCYNPGCCVELIYSDRMRSKIDKETVVKIYEEIFPDYPLSSSQPMLHVTYDKLFFGDMILPRSNSSFYEEDLLLLRDQMKTLRSLAQCINMKWMSIIVGGPASGKSSVVRVISQLAGQKLKTVVVNSAMDTNEILGGFEQTDYNRHLEELFERTENLLLDSLKHTICKSNIKVVKHYHKSLETVRNILDKTSKTQGIDLFLQKLDELYRLVSMMKDLDLHLQELDEILLKLTNLSQIVQREMCLNAGGKFEWVDSLLVKCLKEGHWLLVDQVNFCSPALLDRLNGLLEPNGVLTIGERGTTIDGSIMTIKPHENFRLFLTMDPKYGEISRAMRNRGVEIFLLDQGKFTPDLDVRSLLFNSGLTVKLHQDVLLEIHDNISQDISTTEALNITHLLQSAFLIKQQVSRGFSLPSAFETSCQDVYIKARAISVQQTKTRLELLIQESCKRFYSDDMETNCVPFDLETITWKVEDNLENSKLGRIEQQGALVSYFIKNIDSLTLGEIAEFLNLGNFDMKNVFVNEIFPYALIEFFEKSSIADVELRALWLLKKHGTQKEMLQNSKKLVKEILSFEFNFSNCDLPWDASLPRALTKEAKERNSQDSNKLALLLYWNNMENELLMRQSPKKETVRRYSTEVTNGTMNTYCKDEPLIDNFTPFVNQVRKSIDIILRELLSLSPRDYFKVRLNLHWYKRYYELGNLVLEVDKKRTEFINIGKISLLLKVHYKWLIKFLKMLSSLLSHQLLSENCKTEVNTLFQMIDETNKELFVLYNPILKIAKKIKAAMILPLPYSDKEIADSFSQLLYVTQCLNSWTTILNDEEKMISNLLKLSSPEGLDIRRQLLDNWHTFFKSNCFNTETEEHLLGIKDFCVKNNLRLENCITPGEPTSECSLSPTEEATLSGNIQLWPLYEYMFLRFANRIQQEICAAAFGGAENCQSVEIVTQLWQKWSQVLSIPVNVLAVTNAALLFNQDSEKICRLIPTLSYLLKRFTRGNYALNDFKKLSNWKGFSYQPTEDNTALTPYSQVEQKTRSSPVLLNLILELLLNKTQTKNDTSVLAMPSLGAHESRISQLKKLNILLWRNNASFNSKKFDCLLNDYKMLLTQGNHFLALNENLQLQDQWNLCDIEKNLLLEFKEILRDLEIESQTDEKIFKQGKAWALLGYVQTSLFTSLGYVDPLYKVERKLQYAEEDIKDLKCTFYVKILEGRIFGKKEIDRSHPRFKEIEPLVNNIITDREVLRTKRAYRPANSDFLILVKEFENFRNTLGSFSVVQNHVLELTKVFVDFTSGKSPDIKRAQNVVLRTETWQESLEQFIDRVENRFLSSYPDLILPAFATLSDMKHGINMMTNHIQGMISKSLTNRDLEGLVEKMISFPTIHQRQSSLLDLVDFCTLDSTREVINRNLQVTFDSFREQFKITLSGLHELHNHILLKGKLSKQLWMKLSEIMHQVILIWKQQQKEILQQEADEESMYKSSRTHASVEEEDIKREIEDLFPTYKETDFEFEIDAQRREKENGVKERRSVLLSLEDIKEVNRVYSSILISSTSSNWLKEGTGSKSPDYVNPLLLRCNTVGMLLDNLTASPGSKISERLYSSLNYLTFTTLSICQGKNPLGNTSDREIFDFYKDSNISEVTSCLGILRNILDKITLLLNEWPEHPTLRAIRVVIRRILEFPITSSVARFLTGLELLLVKMKEWEENAHKGVSLFEHMSLLTQQIISWRKLELSAWKDCLNVTFLRLRDQSAKWCFWLYTLLESYVHKTLPEDDYFDDLTPKEEITPEKLVDVLHCFISKSSLVEFEARLELLRTFHCHAFYFDSSPERDQVLAITWNIYNYYKQFIDEVNTKINNLRSPIEKKLKDFVKITRWNDISYWAVKETIAKSHKTLHKFVKEYEKGLKENVTPCLVVKPSNNYLNHKNSKTEVDPDNFLLAPESFEKVNIEFGKNMLSPDQLVNKLKTKITASRYGEIRTNLENLVEEYMERGANLKKIEIDNTLPKPKQISHAKSVLQQKKKALSDYFKTIAHLGVSYRIGILAWKNKQDTVIDLMIPPLDLEALRNFDSKADKLMLDQWSFCENYYQKSVAEFIALTQMLSNAHKDLDPLNVERFKGYSAHMLLMANEQKRTLTEEIQHFVALRSQVYSLKQLNLNSSLPKQEDLVAIARKFKELLIVLQSSLDQLQLCFDACPSKSDIEEKEIYDMEEIPLSVLYVTKDDSLFGNISSTFRDLSLQVRNMSLGFNSLFSPVPILTTKHYDYLKTGNKTLVNLRAKLAEIEKSFGAELNLNHSLTTSIRYVKKRIGNHLLEFSEVEKKTYDNEDLFDFENTLKDLLRTALNTLQIEEEEEEINSCVEEELQKNTITELLIKSLKYKLTGLTLETVSSNFDKLIKINSNEGFRKIVKFIPLLEQYLLFSEFYLTEQVASLRLTCKMLHLQLNVFLDLAINGFCIPKNLELDVDPNGEENSQENTGKGGMGLSNEEGQQDVSDRIESEDQLEEAKQKDQEEADKDEKLCPEEENGIDMSEDFDSKLQNMEKEEDDNEKSDEDDGDLDKEMDETNEGENQQDKELWGDDEKTEEGEENLKNDENAGKGEELDDETMGAKNNEETLPKESEEYKEKEDISELNEPDINDDQIDPYHGNQQPEIEPEALDLPDDINLDNEDEAMDQDKQEEDLFDIDNMKEPTLPPDEAKDDPNEEATEDSSEEPKENAKSDEEKDLESGDEEGDANIEAAPIESETGPTEEDPTEENSSEEQQTVPNHDDADKRGDNAMQVDGIDGTENNPNQETPKEKDASKKENLQDSQNDYGTGKSNQGFGKTESAIDEGGASDERNTENTQKKRKTPKELKDEHKTLLEENEPMFKKSKTDIQEKGNEKDLSEVNDETADKETRFRHVDSKESYNQCAVDAATEDQVKEQASKITMEEEEESEQPDVNMLCEDEPMQEETPSDHIQPEQFSTLEDKNKGKASTAKNECEQMEIDSDHLQIVETEKVERGADSAFFTNLEKLSLDNGAKDYEHTRNEVKQVLAHWRTEPTTEEAINTWNAVSLITDTAARELAEKLRLVLEPTQASRLKGDYKTGKRINMRKIIPYIASQFRKDKIWLRRTKPSKRNYQIVLAIDDSSSMVDNDSKEIAFESLSLISKALTYLEAGQLGVISFGEDVNVLHPLGETFTQESGARLMQKMRFEQTKTKVPQLVDYSIDMFNLQNDSVENAKLLVILSDGRGIFSEGKNRMAYAVRRARLAGVFTVFVVIDNQKNKESILDIRMPIAKPGQPLVIQSYMEHFPFPFYMILRDINALPDILSDALRQWFELIGNMDN